LQERLLPLGRERAFKFALPSDRRDKRRLVARARLAATRMAPVPRPLFHLFYQVEIRHRQLPQ
jgi:hypothetical protein